MLLTRKRRLHIEPIVSRVFLFAGILFFTGHLWGQELAIEGDHFYMDGNEVSMWGIRVASASQSEENTAMLISNLDDYHNHGIRSISVYLQGSSGGYSNPFLNGGNRISEDHLERLTRIIEACGERSMVVIVGLFYQRTMQMEETLMELPDRASIYRALETTVRALRPYRNVIINIANEQNSGLYRAYRPFDFNDPQNIIDLCRQVKTVDPERITGGGGYHDSSNVVIGRSGHVDVLLFDTYAGDIGENHHSGWHYDHFREMGVTGKPMINVEIFGGWTRQFVPPGVFTEEGIQIHLREIDEAMKREGLHVHLHSNPWIQGPADGYPTRYALGGSGTAEDPGIRWWFDHLRDRIATYSWRRRDVYQQPFSSGSIWNTPVGSDAVYVHAGIQQATERGMTVDEDVIVLTPEEGMIGIYRNNAAWNRNKDRCVVEGGLLFSAPIPEDFTVSPDTWDGLTPNSGLAVLMPDGRTIKQTQPFAYCHPGDTATSRYVFHDQDLYGDGKYGAHGGSGLSAIGGALRAGELVPGAGPIRHVLKVNLHSAENLYYDEETKGFRWPARCADSGASRNYGRNRTEPVVKECRMGALLALPPWMDLDSLGFETEPARILAEAFRDYGAYLVDATGWAVYALITEWSPQERVLDEFREAWGFPLNERDTDSPWGRDMDRIFLNLHVVDNNGPDAIGGGGEPRAPIAPEVTPPENLLALYSGLPDSSIAQEAIPLEEGEKIWSGIIVEGDVMPYSESHNSDFFSNRGNQIQPLLLSNRGLYVWSEEPYRFEIRDDRLVILDNQGEIRSGRAGNTLKEARSFASEEFFPPSGKMPDELLFSAPQYNTWIELTYNQNQEDILTYARAIIKNGFPPGVLMIDDTWQEDYGLWDFHPGRFPDPNTMMDELHRMGFKVMLWVCPFVSADQALVVREIMKNRGLLLRKEDPDDTWDSSRDPAVIDWWNGQSALLDFTNPAAVRWFEGRLDYLVKEYGVDGFKLDAGDTRFYESGILSKEAASPNEHSRLFAKFGLRYPLNEYRACWKMAGQPLAQRLRDKYHRWEDLQMLIPHMITEGLVGYTFSCPDMIGGGDYVSFLDLDSYDQELVVRSAQCHALMPMMQFSVAPWRILEEENLAAVKKAVAIRMQFTPLIMDLARHSAETGEPIMSTMEYYYPGRGYEEIRDQFMLGEDLLVAPVVTRTSQREVLLPPGHWIDDTGKKYRGGKTYILEVPIDRIPYFHKMK